MSDIILVARPSRWVEPTYDATSGTLLNHEDLARLPLGLAWTLTPPAHWMFYTGKPADARALWQTLTSSTRRVVGWGVAHLDVPIVRAAAGLEGSPTVTDLAQLIFEASGRRYDLLTVTQANLKRQPSISDAELAEILAAGHTAQARPYVHMLAELIGQLYVQVLENKPLLLPAQPVPAATAAASADQPQPAAVSNAAGYAGDLHFFLESPTSYRVEQAS
jgi:hypothetical protein